MAGILEGEGSFMLGPPSKPNAPIISVEMMDDDVVAKIARLFGVVCIHLPPRRGYRESYKAVARGKRAVDLMRLLRPLLGNRRRAQVDAAVASYHANPHHPCNRRYSWPSDARLLRMRERMSWRELARKIGCSHAVLRRKVLRLMVAEA